MLTTQTSRILALGTESNTNDSSEEDDLLISNMPLTMANSHPSIVIEDSDDDDDDENNNINVYTNGPSSSAMTTSSASFVAFIQGQEPNRSSLAYANQVFTSLNSTAANRAVFAPAASILNSNEQEQEEISVVEIDRRNTANDEVILDTDEEEDHHDNDDDDQKDFELPAKMARIDKEATARQASLNTSKGEEEVNFHFGF